MRDGRVIQGVVFEYFDVVAGNEADAASTIPRPPPFRVISRLLDDFQSSREVGNQDVVIWEMAYVLPKKNRWLP